MNLLFEDKNGQALSLGDICHFFWNPILNQDSEIFEFEQSIEYIPEFASYGFTLKNQSGETCNVSLWALANFSEFGIEKVKSSNNQQQLF